MDNFLDSLGQLVLRYPSWSYAIIGIGMLIQGELTVLLSVFLIVNKALSWGGFLIATLAAAFIAENFLYFLSRGLRHTRFGWRLYYKLKSSRRTQFYLYYLKTNLTKLLITSRFLIATNFIIMLLVGWSKTKYGRFLKSYLLSLLLWFATMTFIAYFLMSGLTYLRSEKIFRQIEIGVAFVVILIFAGEYLLKKLLGKAAALEEKAGRLGELLTVLQKEEEEDHDKMKKSKPENGFFNQKS